MELNKKLSKHVSPTNRILHFLFKVAYTCPHHMQILLPLCGFPGGLAVCGCIDAPLLAAPAPQASAPVGSGRASLREGAQVAQHAVKGVAGAFSAHSQHQSTSVNIQSTYSQHKSFFAVFS